MRALFVLAAALTCACSVNLEGAPCAHNSNCPREQHCASDGVCRNGAEPIDQACAQISSAMAQHLASCIGGEPDAWLTELGATVNCQAIATSSTEGKIAYDWTQVDACVAMFSTRACTDVLPTRMLSSCPALQATVAPGGNCRSSFDCNDGWCATNNGCPGQCRAYVHAGQQPGSSDQCEFGSSRVGGRCIAYAGLSAPCGGGNPQCEPTQLYCDTTAGSTCVARHPDSHTCNALFGVAQLIQDIGAAQLNLECAQKSHCSGAGQCVVSEQLGQTCVSGQYQCAYLETCDPGTSHCTSDPAINQSCANNGEIVGCLDSRCVSATCSAYLPAGASCSNNGDCGPNAHCDQQCKVDVCP